MDNKWYKVKVTGKQGDKGSVIIYVKGGGKKEGGVKAMSDWLDGGGGG